ncbi:ubiquitin-conjugating enzyme family protein (macronuclear) [Tetrahymena thermophila SB210]|uniref:Ubiquitin-conjugating enzyme family protein n=1 Tax=Tetrahymena thermophila (strain SB210) TaxID=312017 RepID=I7MH61_TETTS|nr:ubiquitin-conjugating enzyme family protein [Tetrahymena thermophila SB210]EAS02655.2 ubiquitin-conjugating enzyme family protein [Tetrahymena thermophila SB210]|eukprot:XP_001022900.2 ubiquitin-conjugating enzyme family protein [Tetrahymena thermophila SB210]
MLTALEKIDIFGVGINIMFNQQNKHKTRFGGFITVIIVTLLSLLFLSSIQEMIYKTNPSVIYEQQIVSNPSRYNLTTNNFSFMVTLLDSTFNPIYDETIYRIEGNFLYKLPTINPDGSEGTAQFYNKAIEMELCTEKSFQVENAKDYFLNLPYQKMYCFKNIDDFYLVGQFEMDIFSVIQINVIPCDDQDPQNKIKCMEKTQRDQILSKTLLQVYYTTQVVQVSNNKQPFNSIGATYFWETNIDFLQNINLLYIKTYVEDNQGLIFDDVKTQNSLLFSSERMMMSSKKDFSIYQISLYLEKNKEQKYLRKYLKISEAFSQVGGIFNVLFMIGCIIAQPYSQMQLNRKLFNSTFQISKEIFGSTEINNQIGGGDNSPSNKKEEQDNKRKSQEQLNQKKSLVSQILCKKKSQSITNKKQELQTKKTSTNEISKYKDQKQASNKANDSSILDMIKTQLSEVQISTKEYFLFYFNCFKSYKSQTLEMIDYGSQQVLNYIDICFIINKIIELEKLKTVLLSDQQIKLFDFIPKPSIDYQLVKQMKQGDQQADLLRKSQYQLNQKNKLNSLEDQFSIYNLNSKNKNIRRQFNILSVQNRSFNEKAKEAQVAFNNINKNKDKQSKIDLKLIQMLDDKLVQLLDINLFDESTVGAGTKLQFNNLYNKSTMRNFRSFSNNIKIDIQSDQSIPSSKKQVYIKDKFLSEEKNETSQDKQIDIVSENMEAFSFNHQAIFSKNEISEVNEQGIQNIQKEQERYLVSYQPSARCDLRRSTIL